MAPWRSGLCILPFLVSDRSHYHVLPGDAWSSSAELITKTPRFSWGKGLGYFQAAGLSQSSAQASKQLLVPAGWFLKWPRFLSAPVLRKRLSLCPPARCREKDERCPPSNAVRACAAWMGRGAAHSGGEAWGHSGEWCCILKLLQNWLFGGHFLKGSLLFSQQWRVSCIGFYVPGLLLFSH